MIVQKTTKAALQMFNQTIRHMDLTKNLHEEGGDNSTSLRIANTS